MHMLSIDVKLVFGDCDGRPCTLSSKSRHFLLRMNGFRVFSSIGHAERTVVSAVSNQSLRKK